MGTRQDDSTTLSEGQEEGDDSRRRRVIPGADFDEMIRNARQQGAPPGVLRAAPITVLGMYGKATPPTFQQVAGALNQKDRRELVGVTLLPQEDYKAIEERLSQKRTTRRRWIRVLGVVAAVLIGVVLLWFGAVSVGISSHMR